jgi:hypothetical protein
MTSITTKQMKDRFHCAGLLWYVITWHGSLGSWLSPQIPAVLGAVQVFRTEQHVGYDGSLEYTQW